MQLFAFLFFALLAFSSAKQIQNGLQLLSVESSSSEPSLKIDKQSTIQKFNLYFTPEKDQVLQGLKSSQNSASIESSRQNSGVSEDFYNKVIQKYYADNLKPAPIEEPQEEPARSSSNFFLPREESVYNNKQNYRQLLMDQSKLSRHAQNAQNNKFNQLAKPSVSNSDFFKSASGPNRNEDQEKLEKEIEIILRNFQIDQLRKFNSLNQIRNQKSGRNVGHKKSAVEEEIENGWRQNQAFEFEKLNSPADISKQSFSLSVSNENPENTEERKQIKYILRNGQAFGFERLNSPIEMNNQGSQGRNELHNDSKLEREITKFWRKQQDSQFQRSFIPAGVFNKIPSGWNKNKDNLEKNKQIGNIFRPQVFVYERLNTLPYVSYSKPSGRNENQDNTEKEKLIKFISKNREPKFERQNVPEVSDESPLVINTDLVKSDLEKEIQNILKERFEFQRLKSAAEGVSQDPPIKIHKHAFFSKPLLKTAQVSVPTPVLVAISQPYEVKVPYMY